MFIFQLKYKRNYSFYYYIIIILLTIIIILYSLFSTIIITILYLFIFGWSSFRISLTQFGQAREYLSERGEFIVGKIIQTPSVTDDGDQRVGSRRIDIFAIRTDVPTRFYRISRSRLSLAE